MTMTYKRLTATAMIVIAGIVFLHSLSGAAEQELTALSSHDVMVLYPETLKDAAADIVRLYPPLRNELERVLEWHIGKRPRVFLINDAARFADMVGSPHVLAVADASRNIIAIDYTRITVQPLTLPSVLKHELCHILLGQHIKREFLPRWLDEGIAQWLSDGITEMALQSSGAIPSAVLARNHFAFKKLDAVFPRNPDAMRIAYAQSKSMVNYLRDRFGTETLRDILTDLSRDRSIDEALRGHVGLSLKELESQWTDHLDGTVSWIIYMSRHLYIIIFSLTTLVAVVAYAVRRTRLRKIESLDDDSQDETLFH